MTGEYFLEWTQYDVKQAWEFLINGRSIGKLVQDENRMVSVLDIPAGVLKTGDNSIQIKPSGKPSIDDIRLETLRIRSGSVQEYLSEGILRVRVLEQATDLPLPTRITLMRTDGALAPHGLKSGNKIAARIGTIYSLDGNATIPVPSGSYRIYAGRGFEYSLAQAEVHVKPGQSLEVVLQINKVVNTNGFAACDTHIHTLTHSGHGDATIEERMVTLAGEGIELAIATDHNKYIDFTPVADTLNASQFFTPVTGCEVTTARGHFNVFPISPSANSIDAQQTHWKDLFADIRATPNVGIIILNHPRDLHSGVRPFAIENHYALQGENALGWEIGFNAMEVINSAATQSDIMQLPYDWMALLNRGRLIAPIGCSDSHDVARHFVGQARTYIRCDDNHPGALNVDQCIQAFREGRVTVSYGILVRLIVENRFEMGDIAKVDTNEPVSVQVEVQSPDWLDPTHVQLYVNGTLFAERQRTPALNEEAKTNWRESFEIPPAQFDAHVVAIASGPGIEAGFWRCAKPYQPVSSNWKSHIFGMSGAVWLDRDANGQRNSPRDYAVQVVQKLASHPQQLVHTLGNYDRAIAIQAFSALSQQDASLASSELRNAIESAEAHVKNAFRDVLLELRDHSLTQAKK